MTRSRARNRRPAAAVRATGGAGSGAPGRGGGPRPGPRSLVAAARRILATKIRRGPAGETWQTEAFGFYREVGELRFVANAISNAMSLAELYIAKRDPENGGWMRIESDADPGVQALDALWGDSPTGMEDMLRRIGQHLFLAGESYLVGHPAVPDPDEDGSGGSDTLPPSPTYLEPIVDYDPVLAGRLVLAELTWSVYSSAEVTHVGGMLKVGDAVFHPDACVLIRIHRPDPQFSSQADSPVRSLLPVFRELVGLTKHVSASIDSRLAGAGILVVPASASALGAKGMDDSDEDPFVSALLEAMITPIKDRDSASAVVPLVMTVPDEVAAADMVKHITFSSSLDLTAKELREEAIRRIALGLDAPPERLLGTGEVNHWGAWHLAEDEAKLHVGVPLGIIRDALTREYLRVVLTESGIADAAEYTILADLSALTLRPDRSADGFQLYDRNLISDAALREVTGFGPEDAANDETPVRERAIALALDLVKTAPSLASEPGLGPLVEQIVAVLSGEIVAAPEPIAEVPDAEPATPQDEPTMIAPTAPNVPTEQAA